LDHPSAEDTATGVEYGQSALAADVTTEAKAQLLEAPDGVPREPELGSEAALGQPKSV